MGKHLNFCSDFDFDSTMPNIKFIQVIFIYNSVFKFQVPTHTHTHTYTPTHTHTESNNIPRLQPQPRLQIPACKANSSPTELSLPNHINTLACVKADITHAQEFTILIHCAEFLRHSNVYIFYL